MPKMLEKIIADMARRHQAELEITRDPDLLGCVALLQETADLLTADGFRVWEQVCWGYCSSDRKATASIHLHVDINKDHGREGLRRLLELVPFDPDTNILRRDGATIKVAPRTCLTYGWRPPAPTLDSKEARP